MDRLSRVVTGRRAKWLLPIVWIAVVAAVFAFDLPARFAAVQQNDEVSFLPEDTESVQALRAVQALPGGDTVAAVVVARDPDGDGIGADERSAVRELLAGIRRDRPGAVAGVTDARPSQDGTALLANVQIRQTGDSGALIDTVGAIRDRVDRLASDTGLQAAVTGPAGFSADAADVFGGINSTLLMATAGLVFVLLILIYRSPVFWVIPLAAVGAAELTSRGLGYLVSQLGLDVNGQSAGILLVLVFGAGTDYALLLVSRYREELQREEDHHDAVRAAVRGVAPAILASAATVVCALLVLLLARVSGTASIGPLGAVGVALAMATTLTLLPALLAIAGRRAFWPFIPRVGDGTKHQQGAWRRIADAVTRRSRIVWISTVGVLLVLATGVLTLDLGVPRTEGFRSQVESVRGQELLDRSFPAGTLAPAAIVVPRAGEVERVREVLSADDGVDSVSDGVRRGPAGVVLQAVLAPPPYSSAAYDAVQRLRERFDAAGLNGVLVGGPSAQQRDYQAAARRDDVVVPPIVLGVIFVILALLLRALLLPVLLIASVVLSFAAALGVSAVIFESVFGFPGVEATILLIGFIFLAALGVDYTIFLTTRVREETERHGTREGVRRGLAATGSVITAAGIVLAGTFSTLAILPLVVLTEVGFLIAFGILLDTFVVRSTLVSSLIHDLGGRVWWPSRLDRGGDGDGDETGRGERFSRTPAQRRART